MEPKTNGGGESVPASKRILSTVDGARVIELYVPFMHGEQRIEAITIKPFTFELSLRWREGKISNSLELLYEMAAEGKEALGLVRYPDMDRVMMAFTESLPADIRENIADGVIPTTAPTPAEPEPQFDHNNPAYGIEPADRAAGFNLEDNPQG